MNRCPRPPLCDRIRSEAGQTTAEYALVILGAAALATLLIAFATRSDVIGRLFETVFERVLGDVG